MGVVKEFVHISLFAFSSYAQEIVAFAILLLAACLLTIKRPLQVLEFSFARTLPLRGFLMLLVALHHIPRSVVHFGREAVSVFLFISGYGMMKSFKEKRQVYLDGLIKRYAFKLFIPYAICAVPWMAYIKCNAGGGCLEGIRNGILSSILPASWFSLALMIFCVVFVMSMRFRSYGFRLASLVGGVGSYYVIFRYVLHMPSFWYCTCWAYIVGIIYATHEEDLIRAQLRVRRMYPVGLICLLVVMLVGRKFLYSEVPLLSELPTILFGIAVITLMYYLPFRDSVVLKFAGKVSYEFYLVHACIIALLAKTGITNVVRFSVIVVFVSFGLAMPINLISRRILRTLHV